MTSTHMYISLRFLRSLIEGKDGDCYGEFHYGGIARNKDFALGFIDALLDQGYEQYPLYLRKEEKDHDPDCPAVDGFGCRCKE